MKVMKNKLKGHLKDPVGQLNQRMRKIAVSIILDNPQLFVKQMLHGLPLLLFTADTAWGKFFYPGSYYQQHSLSRKLLFYNFIHFNFNNIKKLFISLDRQEIFRLFKYVFFEIYVLLLCVFMIVAFCKQGRARLNDNRFAHVFLLGTMLYFVLISLGIISYARYRAPIDILIDVYASSGVLCFASWFKEKCFLPK